MTYTKRESYEELIAPLMNVYDIFKDFFGEDNVDLQDLPTEDELFADYGMTLPSEGSINLPSSTVRLFCGRKVNILVHWPVVTVTNENGHSVIVKDLYAKVELTIAGKISPNSRGFLLNRATYPVSHLRSDYMHSHIQGIPTENFRIFKEPCLGTGPIIDTIITLKLNYDPTMWMLFCQELNNYVQVESLRGVPYRYLEQITNSHRTYNMYCVWRNTTLMSREEEELLRPFMIYYLQHGHPRFRFYKRRFTLGMSCFDFLLDMSNTFIEWFNKENLGAENLSVFYQKHILVDCIIQNKQFMEIRNSRGMPSSGDWQHYSGREMCTFKGNTIRITIEDDTNDPTSLNKATVLYWHIANAIMNRILRVINYRYDNYQFKREPSTPSLTENVLYV